MYRSQVAAALYNKKNGTHDADSAGTYTGAPDEPEGQTLTECFHDTHNLFDLMETNGMNIRNNRTKKLLPEMIDSADLVISMAEEPFIPDFLRTSTKLIQWNVENPPLDTAEMAEKTYRHIYDLVLGLIQ